MNPFKDSAILAAQHGLTSAATLYINLSNCFDQHGKEATINAINATIEKLAECETWQKVFFNNALILLS